MQASYEAVLTLAQEKVPYTQGQWRKQKILMGGFIQWHMVVICIWCALFVTSQFDVIFMHRCKSRQILGVRRIFA